MKLQIKSIFRTKNYVAINDGSYGTYNAGSQTNVIIEKKKQKKQTKFKISGIRSCLCDFSDTYILVKATITVANTTAKGADPNNRNKKVIVKNLAPFNDYISEINNKKADHAKDSDVVMAMYNLIEHSDDYSKTSGRSWQYYRDKPFININAVIIDVPNDPDSASFKSKQKITYQTGNYGTKDVQIMVLSKYLCNF